MVDIQCVDPLLPTEAGGVGHMKDQKYKPKYKCNDIQGIDLGITSAPQTDEVEKNMRINTKDLGAIQQKRQKANRVHKIKSQIHIIDKNRK